MNRLENKETAEREKIKAKREWFPLKGNREGQSLAKVCDDLQIKGFDYID